MCIDEHREGVCTESWLWGSNPCRIGEWNLRWQRAGPRCWAHWTPPPSCPAHPPHALLKRDVHLDNVLHMHRMLRGQQEANCSSTLASPCQRWRIQKRIILLPLLRVSPRLNKYDRIHTPAFAGSQSTIQDCCHSLVFKISAHVQPSRLKTRLAGWETFRDKQCAMWFAEYFWDSLKDLGVLFVFLDEPSIMRKIDLWIFGISPLKRWTMKMYLSPFSYVCYTDESG